MRGVLLTLALLILPVMAWGQSQTDDGTRLERFLESQLSDGDDFAVALEGFRGALSSQAQLDRMTISDRDGVWLVLEAAVLDWTRAALLQGEFRVNALTAERVNVLRLPVADNSAPLPTAETTPFSLPDLPVAIEIGEISIGTLQVSEDVLGQPALLSVEGGAALSGGAGHATLALNRLGGPQGQFELDTRYSNDTRDLQIDLSLIEESGGLTAGLLGLPDRPALSFTVAGSGPLSDFAARIALATDGVERFSGDVVSRTDPDTTNHSVQVDLGGDISPLMIAEYRPFFGSDLDVRATVTRLTDGRTMVEDLSIVSAALNVAGRADLLADGHPQQLDLRMDLRDPEGQTVRLPVPGTEVDVQDAQLHVTFDAASGDSITTALQITGLETEAGRLGTLALEGDGRLTRSENMISAVALAVTGETAAVELSDPALSSAVGDAHQLSMNVGWQENGTLTLSDLDVRAGDILLSGVLEAALGIDAAPIGFDLDLSVPSLQRFAAVAGQPLNGAALVQLDGQAELLSGAFDLRLDGSGQDLRIGDGLPAALTAGETQIAVAITRNETGLTLDTFSLDAAELDVTGHGRLGSTDGALDVTAALINVGRFTDAISGPATARLALRRDASGPWRVDGDVVGPVGIAAGLGGQIAMPDGVPDLQITGSLPLALANRALAPRSVQGRLSFDAALDGAFDLGSLSGQFSAGGARLALPTLETALEDLSLSGTLRAGQVRSTVTGRLGTGGTVTAEAQVDLASAGLPGRVAVSGRGLRLVDPTLYEAQIDSADLVYAGALAGAARLSGEIVMGTTELRVPETGLGTAAVPEITHIGETAAQRRTRIAAGLVESGGGTGSGALALDVSVTAPGRIFIRGRGLDAEMGGTLRMTGTTADMIPVGRFDLIRGRLSILGARLDLTEGSASLQGQGDPFVRLLANSRAGDYRIDISVIGPVSAPDIAFASDPALPEDEVLAQLLFGRSVSALSPVQLLQLADAAASLAGGSSNAGLLANLRENTGLDDLDLQTDAEGNAAVRAGRYLSDNVYSDVTVGASGETDLSLNIDLTDNITARGSFSSNGDSSLGVFFERDY